MSKKMMHLIYVLITTFLALAAFNSHPCYATTIVRVPFSKDNIFKNILSFIPPNDPLILEPKGKHILYTKLEILHVELRRTYAPNSVEMITRVKLPHNIENSFYPLEIALDSERHPPVNLVNMLARCGVNMQQTLWPPGENIVCFEGMFPEVNMYAPFASNPEEYTFVGNLIIVTEDIKNHIDIKVSNPNPIEEKEDYIQSVSHRSNVPLTQ